jgi:hypothetical protein
MAFIGIDAKTRRHAFTLVIALRAERTGDAAFPIA